jgi:hypothetical protein
MYLRIINNNITYPYSIKDLREAYANISFPAELSEQMIIEWDMYEVRTTPKPIDYTKNIIEGTPILVEGVYYQNWVQTEASESEIDLRVSAKWEEVKLIRTEMLLECDWTQLSDIPTETKELWQPYRQSLRDITSQSNPFNIVWPDKP